MVLVNSKAGNFKAEALFAQIKESAAPLGLTTLATLSAEDMHSKVIAAVQASAPNIVVGGGDDTVRAALYGLWSAGYFHQSDLRRKITFGIIPLGTFNNFARHLGVRLDVGDSINDAIWGKMIQADLGLIDLPGRRAPQIFNESVGLGLDVEAWRHFPVESPRLIRRLWDGAVAFWRALRSFNPSSFLLRIDGVQRNARPLLLSVANSARFSAGFNIAPGAERDNGKLDFCMLPPSTLLRYLGLPLVAFGWHVNLSAVKYQQITSLEIERKRGFALRIDSEIVRGLNRARITVLPNILPIRVFE